MPAQALRDFQHNLGRAQNLLLMAAQLPRTTPQENETADDVLRASWMFGVGSMDAYFCDAYTDLVASSLICLSREPHATLPPWFFELKVSVAAVVRQYPTKDNWKWRMAIRARMEREDGLDYAGVKGWFNKFMQPNQRLFERLLPTWISRPGASTRLFGTTAAAFTRKTGTARTQAIETMEDRFESRFKSIVKRRHDCIHTCDKPRRNVLSIRETDVQAALDDINFIITQSDDHLNANFRNWLTSSAIGFSATAASGVGY